jgi:hypothetical protein
MSLILERFLDARATFALDCRYWEYSDVTSGESNITILSFELSPGTMLATTRAGAMTGMVAVRFSTIVDVIRLSPGLPVGNLMLFPPSSTSARRKVCWRREAAMSSLLQPGVSAASPRMHGSVSRREKKRVAFMVMSFMAGRGLFL